MISDAEFLIECNDGRPTEPPPALISEYIQDRRVLPPGTPIPGPMNVHYTPYFVEIMDAMGPYSGVSIITVCKGVQIGATANCAENVIAYYMDANPTEILYCSATNQLLEKWTKRLESMIDSCGFRGIIAAQVENTKSRKTGDKMYSKEYPGGSLSMTSLQSPAGLRSESKQIVIIDEIDGAPSALSTGEGSPLFVLHGRAAAFGTRAKFMEFSTPSTFENSVIWRRFEAGDQRKYFVPCRHCKKYQELVFQQLRADYDGETLQIAWYECIHCKGRLDNHDKTWMLANGEWRATASAATRNQRSYHISTLYSPVGMMPWTGVYQKHLDAIADPLQMPSFVNLYLGLPFKEDGSRPDIKKVISLRGNYKNGTVPDGAIYLTLGADVQRGSMKYQQMTEEELTAEIEKMRKAGRNLWKAGLPRIELEVYGVGLHYKSWSVDYRIIFGHTTLGAYQGAFEKMYTWAIEGGMVYPRKDGRKFAPTIILVDGTDGVTQPTVFDFCERMGANTYPTINFAKLDSAKDPGLDKDLHGGARYRPPQKNKAGQLHVQTGTNHYKKTLYTRLGIRRNPVDPQPPAFCEFPRDRPDYYFEMLTAEEMRSNGSFYNGGRPAEALDCRVYALCGADIWLEAQVWDMRDRARKGKYSEEDVKKFNKVFFLTQLQNQQKPVT